MKEELKKLELIKIVYNRSKGTKLDSLIFEDLKNELLLLSKYLDTGTTEAFFITNVLCLNLENDWLQVKNLMSHFDCNMVDLLEYNQELIALLSSSYFDVKHYDDLDIYINTRLYFKCNEAILLSIMENKKLDLSIKVEYENDYCFIEKLFSFIEEHRYNPRLKMKNIRNLESNFKTVNLITKNYKDHPINLIFEKYDFDNESKIMFAYILWKGLICVHKVDVNELCQHVYGENVIYITKYQEFKFKKHFLIKDNWLELENDELIISNYAKKILTENGFYFHEKTKKPRTIKIARFDEGLIYDKII